MAIGASGRAAVTARTSIVDLEAMTTDEVTPADINRWTNALAQKPDG